MGKILDRILVFSKAQVSAFVGGITDYFVMEAGFQPFGVGYDG